MRIELQSRAVLVWKEADDVRYANGGYAGHRAAESRMWYHIQQTLKGMGVDTVKVNPAFGAGDAYYLRERKGRGGLVDHFYDHLFATRCIAEDFNAAEVGQHVTIIRELRDKEGVPV